MAKIGVIAIVLISILVPLAFRATQARVPQELTSFQSWPEQGTTRQGQLSSEAGAELGSGAESARVFVYEDIDEIREAETDPATGLENTRWHVYEDIMFPGTRIEWEIGHETKPSRDGSALKCAITGGDQYNNIFCNTTVAKRWRGAPWPYRAGKRLVYSLWFYVDGTIDCKDPNRSSIEGLEFGWQHTLIPLKHEFAVQWSKGGRWRYWDASVDPATGRPRAWTAFRSPIVQCIADHTWHQIQFESYISGDASYYRLMRFGGVTYDLGHARAPRAEAPSGWVENFLQVSVQINGNTALDGSQGVDPVSVYLDQVRLEGFIQPAAYVPRVQK